ATGKPIKLIATGEKLDALEEFYPSRIADRILGMGDIVSLVEKAAETVNAEDAAKMAKKLRKGSFDLDDLRNQLLQMKKMGGMGGLGALGGMFGGQAAGMLPDVSKMDTKQLEAAARQMGIDPQSIPGQAPQNLAQKLPDNVGQLLKSGSGLPGLGSASRFPS